MKFIQTFKNISKSDVALAGGKGASLGEMTQARIPVPGGFVILSEAFNYFITATGVKADIDATLHEVNHEDVNSVEQASQVIQSIITSREMPKEIASEIMQWYDREGSEFVAVRSSATAEDSSTAAWAGQLDTFLNTTKDDLLENVMKCWASLFTPRAIFYRFEKGLHDTHISVAVVIQKMVNSDISGIAFSVHPVTQDRNQLIIEAGFGLGESIVSGQITPDGYVVEKKSWTIINLNVSEQSKGLYRNPKGGNDWRDFSPEEGGKQKLSGKQIVELAQLVVKIENHYGFPCDIEWAVER